MADQHDNTNSITTDNSPDSQYDPWNRANEKAVINLVNESTSEKFLRAYKYRPDLFGLDEYTLKQKLRAEKKFPTPTDNRLRLAFWNAYEQVQSGVAKNIALTRIAAGICAPEFLVQEYFRYPEKVAWILTPPASYEVLAEEGLQFGLEQLREILETDHYKYDPDGKITRYDSKLMEIKIKITAMLDQRVKGAVVQRIEQKSLNVNVTEKQVQKIAELNTMQEIEDALQKLRKRDKHRQELLAQQTIEVKQEPAE